MVKLKLLSQFSEYDKTEVNRALDNILNINKKLSALEKKAKISGVDESLNCRSSNKVSTEIKEQWDDLKKVSEDLDYIFDF